MRCYICDDIMKPPEIVWKEEETVYEPCPECIKKTKGADLDGWTTLNFSNIAMEDHYYSASWLVLERTGALINCCPPTRVPIWAVSDTLRNLPEEEFAMKLTTEQKILIEQQVANESKSSTTAYLLWVFLSGLGMHRFYLDQKASAVIQLLLFVFGFLLLVVGIGIVFLIVWFIWVLIDAFLIPGMFTERNDHIRERLILEEAAETAEE